MRIAEAPEFRHYTRDVANRHFGLEMGQNIFAPMAISLLLDEIKPRNIIELGIGVGGLSFLIAVWARIHDANYYGWGLNAGDCKYHDFLIGVGANLFFADIFNPGRREDIAAQIRGPLTSLILCDNGNKKSEVGTFGPALKSGDYIMAHDYFADGVTVPDYWDWCEIQAKDFDGLDLVPVYEKLLAPAAWGCYRKA